MAYAVSDEGASCALAPLPIKGVVEAVSLNTAHLFQPCDGVVAMQAVALLLPLKQLRSLAVPCLSYLWLPSVGIDSNNEPTVLHVLPLLTLPYVAPFRILL